MKCLDCSREVSASCKRCDACLKRKRVNTRRWRKQQKLNGKCQDCPNVTVGSSIYCQSCLGKQKLRREKLKQLKLCLDCSCPVDDKKRCKDCIEKRKQEKLRRIANGKCVHCDSHPRMGCIQCEECLRKRRELKKKRCDQGFCPSCGGVTSGKRYCLDCLDKFKQRRKNFISQGRCYSCGGQPLPARIICETCCLKGVARSIGGTKRWQELKSLFIEQGGICPYTGKKLLLGIDAELDHIIPRVKGGTNARSNLQWVLKAVNRMKWDNKEEDFLSLVKLVYNYKGLANE